MAQITFFLWLHYPSTFPSTFNESFQHKIFQGRLKLRPRLEQVEFTTALLHKLKWMPCFENSVENSFEFGPNAASG